MKHSMTCAFLLALAVVNPSWASTQDKKKDPVPTGNREVGKGLNFYSLEDEIALSRQLAVQVERQAKLVDDPVVSEYVNRIGQNLARNSDVRVPVTVKAIDDDQVNAFALPGGFVFVNAGLLLKADNEAQVAGVLAHELAHVAARHGTRQASRGQVANWASLPLIFMGGWGGYAARQAAGLAVPLTFLKYSRDFEREADRLGVQYLYQAGYDPAALVDFFEKLEALEKERPGTMAELFRSHPVAAERITRTQKNIQELVAGRAEFVVTTSEFGEVRGRLEKLLSRRKSDPRKESGPVLRRGEPTPTPQEEATTPNAPGFDDDGRPTLRRQPQSGGI